MSRQPGDAVRLREHAEFQPEGTDGKEVFAFFGLAAFYAQLLEKGLQKLALALELHKSGILTTENEARIFDTLDLKTLGQLIRHVQEITQIPRSVKGKLYLALEKRNILFHRFHSLHVDDFLGEAGRRDMIDELIGFAEIFGTAYKLVAQIKAPLYAKIGITDEQLQKQFDEALCRAIERDGAS